ncbi:hypothetical protein IQ07DRAFT_650254 [Pyrenochaeta sp. DS3sAY3a]|nr:hypothetical protein IQ07DRAFT_650254 [Pyrenochaeta sp. DS3sAY3a]
MQIKAAPRAIKVLETLRVQIEMARSEDTMRSESAVGNRAVPQEQEGFAAQLDLSQFNFDITNSFTDGWFSQQMMNLDYMQGM